jgi:hypothetical protein
MAEKVGGLERQGTEGGAGYCQPWTTADLAPSDFALQ